MGTPKTSARFYWYSLSLRDENQHKSGCDVNAAGAVDSSLRYDQDRGGPPPAALRRRTRPSFFPFEEPRRIPMSAVNSTPSVLPSIQDDAPAVPASIIEPLAPAAPAFADFLMGVDLPSAEEILATSASQVVANLPPVVATNTGLKAPAANLTDVATKADIAELKDILSRYGIA